MIFELVLSYHKSRSMLSSESICGKYCGEISLCHTSSELFALIIQKDDNSLYIDGTAPSVGVSNFPMWCEQQ